MGGRRKVGGNEVLGVGRRKIGRKKGRKGGGRSEGRTLLEYGLTLV